MSAMSLQSNIFRFRTMSVKIGKEVTATGCFRFIYNDVVIIYATNQMQQ